MDSSSLELLKAQFLQLSAGDRLAFVRSVMPLLQGKEPRYDWQFLRSRPHPWREQLYIKGRKLLASTIWQDMVSNHMTPEEAAENWDLPLPAIQEVILYCETHQDLLKLEAEEELLSLREQGFSIEPISAG